MHLTAVSTAYGFYKSRGLAPFKNAKVACNPVLDKEAEPKDDNKFEDAIRAMANFFQSREAKADRFAVARHEGRYNSYLRNTTAPRRAVLVGVLVSRVFQPETVYKWAYDQTQLDGQLKHIVDTVFTHNTVHSDTIPMTKCLRHKCSSGGGGGSSGGDGDSGSSTGHDAGDNPSESDTATVREIIGSVTCGGSKSSGYDAGNDSDVSTVRQTIGNSDESTVPETFGTKRCAPDSDSRGSLDYY